LAAGKFNQGADKRVRVSMVDALSDVLRLVKLSSGIYLDAEFSAPWCVRSQLGPEECSLLLPNRRHVISYHYVAGGRLLVRVGDSTPTEVCAGQIVLFPRNDMHYLGSVITEQAPCTHELIQMSDAGGLLPIVHGGGGEKTRMVCGFLGGEGPHNPLLATLPPMLVLDVRDAPGGDWIRRLFDYGAHGITGSDPGAATVLSKISELLFIEAIRRYLANLPGQQTGWLAGLRDAAIGKSLALIHTRLADEWTARTLAREVGLSRSVFADRFTALIGAPPKRYLTSWRLHVAADKLREDRLSVAKAAFEVGYKSDVAFTRAFKREFGTSPAVWRRQAEKAVAKLVGIFMLLDQLVDFPF
jgi:AraC-like DNA-binding protein